MDQKSVLEQALEDILLNESEFEKLKRVIAQTITGKKSDKFLRHYIFKFLVNKKDALLTFFPSYAKVENEATISLPSEELQKELQERNELLEQLGTRIHNIYIKLKEKELVEKDK
ncbi:MAG: hypothetical protein ACFFBZ_08785 [Promethearchaeota archaeon]